MNQINGVVTGVVSAVDDKLKQGRIKVRFPWLDDQHESDWIRIASLMAGGGRGAFFMPEVDDEVLCAFEHGAVDFPYVVGFLWNGKDATPGQDVRDRKIVSKNGHSIRFLDSTPAGGNVGALVIEDGHGNRITMSNGKITITAASYLVFNAAHILLNGRYVSPTKNPI
jgi:uncharacterized protein involved in type VI secretion and phage assembly